MSICHIGVVNTRSSQEKSNIIISGLIHPSQNTSSFQWAERFFSYGTEDGKMAHPQAEVFEGNGEVVSVGYIDQNYGNSRFPIVFIDLVID